jgi:hypothetical protein
VITASLSRLNAEITRGTISREEAEEEKRKIHTSLLSIKKAHL